MITVVVVEDVDVDVVDATVEVVDVVVLVVVAPEPKAYVLLSRDPTNTIPSAIADDETIMSPVV